ncbi:MAG: hypothetical protein HY001_02170 [Candidatus Portnoybacteria bacterium]|nr:hypothetical protein [Candidatus Portnoybacteria bacterium]
MPTVFLDANIYFAAVRSRVGGSYFVIELAKKKSLRVVAVAHVLAEAERNIEKKVGEEALRAHYENLLTIKPVIQSLTFVPIEFEEKLGQCLPEKDLPIILGALLSGTEVLITLDQKHFLKNEKLLKLNLPIAIMTPGEFIKQYIL